MASWISVGKSASGDGHKETEAGEGVKCPSAVGLWVCHRVR